jgi:hypothetical protein
MKFKIKNIFIALLISQYLRFCYNIETILFSILLYYPQTYYRSENIEFF